MYRDLCAAFAVFCICNQVNSTTSISNCALTFSDPKLNSELKANEYVVYESHEAALADAQLLSERFKAELGPTWTQVDVTRARPGEHTRANTLALSFEVIGNKVRTLVGQFVHCQEDCSVVRVLDPTRENGYDRPLRRLYMILANGKVEQLHNQTLKSFFLASQQFTVYPLELYQNIKSLQFEIMTWFRNDPSTDYGSWPSLHFKLLESASLNKSGVFLDLHPNHGDLLAASRDSLIVEKLERFESHMHALGWKKLETLPGPGALIASLFLQVSRPHSDHGHSYHVRLNHMVGTLIFDETVDEEGGRKLGIVYGTQFHVYTVDRLLSVFHLSPSLSLMNDSITNASVRYEKSGATQVPKLID